MFVGKFQLAVVLEFLEIFLAAVRVDNLRKNEGIAAEGFSRALLGIEAQTVDGGPDQDDAGDADHDPEQCQKSAEFMGAQRIPGEAKGADQLEAKSRFAGYSFGHRYQGLFY